MPLENLLENEFEFIHQTKQPINVVENMEYWKFEKFCQLLNKKNEQLEKQHKKQNDEQSKQQTNNGSYNPSKMMKKFKMPKF